MNMIYEEIRVALHIIWRRRWLVLAIAWAFCVAGWLVVSLIPNKYQSRARISVQMNALLPDKAGAGPGDPQAGIDRVRQTLTSTENLIKVVRSTDLSKQAASKADAAALANKLRSGITVISQPDNFFDISAETSIGGLTDAQNAKLSHDVVQRLIALFVESNLAGDRIANAQSIRFLNEEIARRQKGLTEAEARKVAFDQKFMGGLPGTGSIEQRMEVIQSELSTIDQNLVSAQSGLAAMNAQIASTPATMAMPGVGGGSPSRAAALEGQLADAQAKGWTEQHPDVIAIRSQLARVRSGGGSAAGAPVMANPMYATIRSMQAEKQATVSALNGRKGQLMGDLNRLTSIQINQPGMAAEQTRLNRDYEVLKDQYDKLISDREDVRLRTTVANRSDAVQFSVIDPPSTPRIPSSPNRPLLLIAILVLGVGLGTGTAFAQGQLKTSYATADRLSRATGMIVLGSIPETITAPQLAERAHKMKLFLGAAGALGGACLLLLVIEFVQRGLMA